MSRQVVGATAIVLGLACNGKELTSEYKDPWREDDADVPSKNNPDAGIKNPPDARADVPSPIQDPDYVPDASSGPDAPKPDTNNNPPDPPSDLEIACTEETPTNNPDNELGFGEFNFYLTYNGSPRLSLFTPGCATDDVFLFMFKRLEDSAKLVFRRECYEIADYYLEWDGEYYDWLSFVLPSGTWHLLIFATCLDCQTFTPAAEALGFVPAYGYYWPPGDSTLNSIYTPCN